MHARFIVALVVVFGLVAFSAPATRLLADRSRSTFVGSDGCAQDDVPVTTPPNPDASVVMCGLDNPRGLAFGQHALYVAEAGRGGLRMPVRQCFTGQAGAVRCYGANGAITRLWDGVQERIVTELPSQANTQGRQAIGATDIAVVRGADVTVGFERRPVTDDCRPDCLYVTIGLFQSMAIREAWPFLHDFARLARVTADFRLRYVADLGAYEAERDPDREFYRTPKLDTNPHGLLAEPSGRAVLLTDASGNSLLRVDTSGEVASVDDISTVAAFAPHPDDSVPTAVVLGPDGAHYIGELTGFPAVVGAANIYRIGGAGEPPEVCLTGFTQVIDIAFDNRGDLYVLEYATVFTQPPVGGTVIRVAPDRRAARDRDRQSVMCAQYAAGDRTAVVTGLTQPTSVAIGADGGIYVSNRGISPDTGQVLRFEPAGK